MTNLTNQYTHQAVLLHEAVAALALKPDGIYLDGTFGRGGHSRLILNSLNSADGTLIVVDQDPLAIQSAQKLYSELESNKNNKPKLIIQHDSFGNISQILQYLNISKLDGILLDLGVSSPQLDDPSRGFSFSHDGPLDMRMDNSDNSKCKFTAESWINSVNEQDLANILWQYGEEKFSRKIAKAILASRKINKITRTGQLAEIIKTAHPKWPKFKHPATQSFLAIRLFINQELQVLEQALEQSLAVLNSTGRLAIITFHSLEDRIVKNFMNKYSKENFNQNSKDLLKKLPLTNAELNSRGLIQPPRLKIVQNPLKAGIIEDNIRARSAILRVAEKI
ncbi:MAG: 16S rRNA (cytosine(1402)-N(4))-methyltransferase RsmH [Gammaproteobacteria bacterium]|nr:16S rRNA (cytosine(1402)-N(4))-methyltransferase RsmH [Gammaproteobacteria bacterium]